MNTPELRRRYRRARRALPLEAQIAHSQAVVRAVASSRLLLKASVCGIYFAQPGEGELDPRPLLARLWSMSKIVGCPVVAPDQSMDLYQVQPTTRLVANRYGIPEPGSRGKDAGRYLSPLTLSVLFMPLVAFDDTGSRLGMGAGYYDRYVGRLPPALRPLLIGLAHEAQRASAALPRQSWDIPLDAVVTESGWQPFTVRAMVG